MLFAALHEFGCGPSRNLAATQHLGRFRSEADIASDWTTVMPQGSGWSHCRPSVTQPEREGALVFA